MKRRFEDLSPEEVLALGIHVERANARRFQAFADAFRGYDAEVVRRFEELAAEEVVHEAQLSLRFRERFGEPIPTVEEADVEGVIESVELDDAEHFIFDSLKPARVYELALRAERGAQDFYRRALSLSSDEPLSSLYRELADAEGDHIHWLERKLRAHGRPATGPSRTP